jgi:GC-rich sequence DNA-binding factor
MEGASPVSSFKKRTIRPSSSSSSIRSLAASPSTSTLSKETTNDAEQEDEGNVAIVRARGKKTTVGRVKDREGTKKASRLSFGGGAEEDVNCIRFSVEPY